MAIGIETKSEHKKRADEQSKQGKRTEKNKDYLGKRAQAHD